MASNDDFRPLKDDTTEQLKDVTIIVASVEYDDDGNSYAITRAYRGSLEGNIDDFINHVDSSRQLVHFSMMKDRHTC